MKIAIVLRGGVSKITGRQLGVIDNTKHDKYIDIKPCAESFNQHIILPNSEHQLDIYIHTWNVDLLSDLSSLYNPLKIVGEDNALYEGDINERCKESLKFRVNASLKSRIKNILGLRRRSSADRGGDFAGISQALAIKKGIELALIGELSNEKYDALFLYRPDLLLTKDIKFSEYKQDQITCNFMGEDQGDFHFYIPRNYVNEFSKLYDSPFLGNYHDVHHWIKRYVKEFMRVRFGSDVIKAGYDQEVLRKIRTSGISFEVAHKYGLSKESWGFLECGL